MRSARAALRASCLGTSSIRLNWPAKDGLYFFASSTFTTGIQKAVNGAKQLHTSLVEKDQY
jgi:X-X-X-Leu-X-X-Gly heptad repeat protein